MVAVLLTTLQLNAQTGPTGLLTLAEAQRLAQLTLN